MILSISTERDEDITTVMTHRNSAYLQTVSSHWGQTGWTSCWWDHGHDVEHYIFIGFTYVESLWGKPLLELNEL